MCIGREEFTLKCIGSLFIRDWQDLEKNMNLAAGSEMSLSWSWEIKKMQQHTELAKKIKDVWLDSIVIMFALIFSHAGNFKNSLSRCKIMKIQCLLFLSLKTVFKMMQGFLSLLEFSQNSLYSSAVDLSTKTPRMFWPSAWYFQPLFAYKQWKRFTVNLNIRG